MIAQEGLCVMTQDKRVDSWRNTAKGKDKSQNPNSVDNIYSDYYKGIVSHFKPVWYY